jgi:hypothetical protein
MFDKETVLILGAGASWHYNYPTGEALVVAIRNVAKKLLANCLEISQTGDLGQIIRDRFQGVVGFRDQLDQLINKLDQMQPLVIDYFLGQNPEIALLGKTIVAHIILEREAKYLQSRKNSANKLNATAEANDWVRFIVHGLLDEANEPEKVLKNKISFVTFNYDLSLERRIYEALNAVESLRMKGIPHLFFDEDRVIHMYGKVREDFKEMSHRDDGEFSNVFHRALFAADGLRTIAPLEKKHDATISRAQTAIAKAKFIYILGYGFDKNNNELLGFDQFRRGGYVNVFLTNFENRNKVSKAAAQALNLDYASLIGDSYNAAQTYNEPRYHAVRVEKSIRTVYDALALDFDWPS